VAVPVKVGISVFVKTGEVVSVGVITAVSV
jgi:hypothetical protein